MLIQSEEKGRDCFITILHAKLLRKLGSLTRDQMSEIEEALLFWLGFEEENAEEDED